MATFSLLTTPRHAEHTLRILPIPGNSHQYGIIMEGIGPILVIPACSSSIRNSGENTHFIDITSLSFLFNIYKGFGFF